VAGTRKRIEASHVIAYQDGGHRYLRDGIVITEGGMSFNQQPLRVRLRRLENWIQH
jgi:hypothetical protein